MSNTALVMNDGMRVRAVEASCRGVYSVKAALARDLADIVTLDVLSMALRLKMQREGYVDNLNLGHLRDDLPHDIRTLAGDI